jgi:hypothetical protein
MVIESRQRRRPRSRRRGRCPFIECIQWRDSCCMMVLTGRNRGMTWPEWERERLIVLSASRRPAPLIVPNTRTSFKAFRNYRLPRRLAAFQKRFRLLELPLPEIRPEFHRNTSNAGMVQSGTPRLARFQEFHRLSMRRHRVLSRQSGGLKPKNPGLNPPSLLRLIVSPVAFVFSS